MVLVDCRRKAVEGRASSRTEPEPRDCLFAALVGVAWLGLVCGGCIIPRNEADCPATSDCNDCVATSGCGFCLSDYNGSAGVCIPGTSFGPDDEGACLDHLWRFDACNHPPRVLGCEVYDSVDCIFAWGCSWCHGANECRPEGDTWGC